MSESSGADLIRCPVPATAGVPDFDALYTDDPDPWDVEVSWYEQRKIAVLLACLRRERYRLAWDAACGTGHLVVHLAGRCDAVLASDGAATAAALTRARTAHLPQVRTIASRLPSSPPPEDQASPAASFRPDLIVLSEVLYYLEEDERERCYSMLDTVAAPDADIVSVHWRPRAEDFLLPGALVHRELGDALAARGWHRLVTHTDEEFLAGVWSRTLPERIGR